MDMYKWYALEVQSCRERGEKKRAELNQTRLKLIQLRLIVDGEEKRILTMWKNILQHFEVITRMPLKEEEYTRLDVICWQATELMKDAREKLHSLKRVLDKYIEYYDNRRKNHRECIPPPPPTPQELEQIRKMLEGDTASDAK